VSIFNQHRAQMSGAQTAAPKSHVPLSLCW